MTPKKLTLTQFVARYSSANRTEYEVMAAIISKMEPGSEAHKLASKAMVECDALFEYLTAAGFEL